MRRFLTVLLGMVLLGPFHGVASSPSGDPLASFQWKYRLLIVFDEPAAIAALRENAQVIAERDVLWFVLGPDALVTNAPDAAPEPLRSALNGYRKRQAGQAELVLIGKDGGVKQRLDTLDLEAVWVRIDGMPMRRAEMRRSADRENP